MANTFSYAELFEPILDEQLAEVLTSAFMEADPKNIQIVGAKKIKVRKLSMSGLSDYDRDNGYTAGGLTLAWEELELDQDRGKRFNIDRLDADESNFDDIAMVGLSEFQRVQVAPELDAYRYSKIFALSNQKLRTGAYTPAAATVYSALKADIKKIQKVIGEAYPLRIAISYDAMDLLESSTEITKMLSITDFSNGVINTKVKAINNIPLFKVPDARFYSAYNFLDTEAGGFEKATNGMAINWIIMAEGAAVAKAKTSGVKVVQPDVNQTYDGWSTYFRKYHGCWILDNRFAAIWVSYTPIGAPALTATVAAGSATGSTKFTATPGAGNVLKYSKTAAALAVTPLFNDVPTGLTAYTSGADIASATAGQHLNMFELDATGHVVAFTDHTIVSGDIK